MSILIRSAGRALAGVLHGVEISGPQLTQLFNIAASGAARPRIAVSEHTPSMISTGFGTGASAVSGSGAGVGAGFAQTAAQIAMEVVIPILMEYAREQIRHSIASRRNAMLGLDEKPFRPDKLRNAYNSLNPEGNGAEPHSEPRAEPRSSTGTGSGPHINSRTLSRYTVGTYGKPISELIEELLEKKIHIAQPLLKDYIRVHSVVHHTFKLVTKNWEKIKDLLDPTSAIDDIIKKTIAENFSNIGLPKEFGEFLAKELNKPLEKVRGAIKPKFEIIEAIDKYIKGLTKNGDNIINGAFEALYPEFKAAAETLRAAEKLLKMDPSLKGKFKIPNLSEMFHGSEDAKFEVKLETVFRKYIIKREFLFGFTGNNTRKKNMVVKKLPILDIMQKVNEIIRSLVEEKMEELRETSRWGKKLIGDEINELGRSLQRTEKAASLAEKARSVAAAAAAAAARAAALKNAAGFAGVVGTGAVLAASTASKGIAFAPVLKEKGLAEKIFEAAVSSKNLLRNVIEAIKQIKDNKGDIRAQFDEEQSLNKQLVKLVDVMEQSTEKVAEETFSVDKGLNFMKSLEVLMKYLLEIEKQKEKNRSINTSQRGLFQKLKDVFWFSYDNLLQAVNVQYNLSELLRKGGIRPDSGAALVSEVENKTGKDLDSVSEKIIKKEVEAITSKNSSRPIIEELPFLISTIKDNDLVVKSTDFEGKTDAVIKAMESKLRSETLTDEKLHFSLTGYSSKRKRKPTDRFLFDANKCRQVVKELIENPGQCKPRCTDVKSLSCARCVNRFFGATPRTGCPVTRVVSDIFPFMPEVLQTPTLAGDRIFKKDDLSSNKLLNDTATMVDVSVEPGAATATGAANEAAARAANQTAAARAANQTAAARAANEAAAAARAANEAAATTVTGAPGARPMLSIRTPGASHMPMLPPSPVGNTNFNSPRVSNQNTNHARPTNGHNGGYRKTRKASCAKSKARRTRRARSIKH